MYEIRAPRLGRLPALKDGLKADTWAEIISIPFDIQQLLGNAMPLAFHALRTQRGWAEAVRRWKTAVDGSKGLIHAEYVVRLCRWLFEVVYYDDRLRRDEFELLGRAIAELLDAFTRWSSENQNELLLAKSLGACDHLELITTLEELDTLCRGRLEPTALDEPTPPGPSAEDVVRMRKLKNRGGKVFIGHGHSKEWLALKEFLKEDLRLPCDAYESESTAGKATKERLQRMLERASFAFLVMTGENLDPAGLAHARENVIHEAGLFQGKLGFEKAIIVLEEGCQEFSNIYGLGEIRFPRGQIDFAFEKVRKVLMRERIIGS